MARCTALALACSAFAGSAGVSADGGEVPGAPILRLARPRRVRIASGYFTMGATPEQQSAARALCAAESSNGPCDVETFAAEGPAHRVWLPAYTIDRLEVSVAQYARCQAALACPPPRAQLPSPAGIDPGTMPVTGVTHHAAARYCAHVGGRLPTEAEWERAAGAGVRRFPWGQQWNDRLSRHGGRRSRDLLGRSLPDRYGLGPAPVAAMPDGDSLYGVRNLSGNVWEWTADRFGVDYYGRSPQVDPRGPSSGTEWVVRGGSYLSLPHQQRSRARRALPEGGFAADVGFRCAYRVDSPSALEVD